MADILRQAIVHEGFSVVEIMTQCPTYFGRKNKLGSAVDMLNHFLLDELTARGQKCRVDFTAAEIIVVIEAIHTQCGLDLVTKEMKARFPFIKVK